MILRSFLLAATLMGNLAWASAPNPPLETSLESIRSQTGSPAVFGIDWSPSGAELAAVGVRKRGDPTPVTVLDQFHLGSNTKAMTATLAAVLVERGLIRWDSTIAQLFPELTAPPHRIDPQYLPVTLEMLLAHRGGTTKDLSSFGDGSLWRSLWDQTLSPRDGRNRVAEAVLQAPPAHPPGSGYYYSNAGYMIAGAMLERATGEEWETLMRQLIFAPSALDMPSCGFGAAGASNAPQPDQPWGHFWDGSQLLPIPPGLYADNPPSLGPAGTVHCGLEDYLKFVKMHLDGFNGSARLVKLASFRKLHESYPGQSYTYGGWNRVEREWAGGPVLVHDGSNRLHYVSTWIAPIKNTIVIAGVNAGAPVGNRAASDVVEVLLQRLGLIP